MSIVVSTNWPYVTPEQYEALHEAVRYETDPPQGAVSHLAWFTEGGLNVVDVWETQADFEQFAAEVAEFSRQRGVQREARKTDGRRGQRSRRGGFGFRKESGGAGADGPGLVKQFTQSQPRERGLSPAADEFAADAMPRIVVRLEDRGGHFPAPQRQAQGKAAQKI